MLSTREIILCEAKKLFNSKGYNDASLRDIANACNISIGNLTYHFKKKEVLVLEIQNTIYRNLSTKLKIHQDYSLKGILNQFKQIHENQLEYIYYFKNILELCKSFEEIKDKQQNIRIILNDYYNKCFNEMKNHGVLRKDLSESNYSTLAFSFILHNTLWFENGSPTYDETFNMLDFEDYLHDMLFPYLTEHGKAEYIKLVD